MSSPEPMICSNCVEPLDSTFIECADCSNSTDDSSVPSTSGAINKPKTIRLCVDCFCCGAELGNHKRNHRYLIRSPGDDVCLFPGRTLEGDGIPWTSREEFGLLDGIERFNLGNWEDVANIFVRANGPGQRRSAREMLEHYDRYYLHGPLGRMAIGGLKRPEDRDHTQTLTVNVAAIVVSDDHDHSKMQISPPMREALKKISSDDFRLLAYMPQRDDFEKEFNNEAETLISNLMILPDDDELDKAVKVAQIEMYVREVADRRRRKLVAREYDLVSMFLKQEKSFTNPKAAYSYAVNEMKKMKMEKELKEQLKKCAQFVPSAELEQLIADVVKERTLKERIKELQDYRREGVTTLEGEKRLKANENLISNRQSNEDETERSASRTGAKRTSIDGIECASGKSVWPKPTLDADTTKSTLSLLETKLCNGHKLSSQDYVLLKAALLKEQAAKSQGMPLKANVGGGNAEDVLELKDVVKDFMKRHGWLPYFS